MVRGRRKQQVFLLWGLGSFSVSLLVLGLVCSSIITGCFFPASPLSSLLKLGSSGQVLRILWKVPPGHRYLGKFRTRVLALL